MGQSLESFVVYISYLIVGKIDKFYFLGRERFAGNTELKCILMRQNPESRFEYLIKESRAGRLYIIPLPAEQDQQSHKHKVVFML